MSPRAANPAVRPALIQAAARLLATGGPGNLSTRRLAAEVGTSTMTIYTHFGSMDDLHAAVRSDGFARIASALGSHAAGEDSVANLAAGGMAYLDAALAEPELYRAMFNHRPPPGDDAGNEVFDLLVDRVRRCIEAARFTDADPSQCPTWAGEVWTALHGMATLALAGVLPGDSHRFLLTDMIFRLAIGFGDDPVTARRSVDQANSAHQASAAIARISASDSTVPTVGKYSRPIGPV